ncbi:MAG: hypothetical protein B6I26_07915 [Desulfobacteraceae bacterium 4572_130]|nr:MAG: hypothetical protein B6I26_07915 [Desulfobacteraceae bacterium 4572_130]
MNSIDIIIIVIILFCIIRGFFRGFIKEISSIAGIFIGFYGAYSYYNILSSYLEIWITNYIYRNFISFLIIFCVLLIAVNFIGILIRYFSKLMLLGWIGRLCGMCLGALKGLIIISMLFFIITIFFPKGIKIVAQSWSYPYVISFSKIISPIITKNIKQEWQGKLKSLK